MAAPGAVFDACMGTSIDNNAITLGDLPPGLAGISINYTNTLITVPADTTTCAPPTITKTAVEDPDDRISHVDDHSSTTPQPRMTASRAASSSRTPASTRDFPPTLTGGATCTNTSTLTATHLACSMPAGSTVSLHRGTESRADAPVRRHHFQQHRQPVRRWLDRPPFTGVGNTITLTGDPTTCLLPTIVKIG